MFQYIQQNAPLVISIDGSKDEKRSGGSWIIALECGTRIISGYNPNLNQIRAINFYRSEVYASLAATLFLYLYSKYYVVKVNNNIHAFCDNQSNVHKLTWPLEDD